MSLEGRLRELGLPEVLQLLGLSRKTGTLRLRAQVQGRAAFVRLTGGAVVDAAQWRLADVPEGVEAVGLATSASAARAVEGCVLDLLTWRDGDFRFTPDDGAPVPSPVRIAVDMLLVASAQQAESWERLGDRIPHAHVVPAFVDVEPQQLPLLRLVPQEWEILTRVDGNRDLTELAVVLGRELLDVAEIVHGLIGSGLLALREAERAPRRNPTPPTGAPVREGTSTPPTAASAASPRPRPRRCPRPARRTCGFRIGSPPATPAMIRPATRTRCSIRWNSGCSRPTACRDVGRPRTAPARSRRRARPRRPNSLRRHSLRRLFSEGRQRGHWRGWTHRHCACTVT